jgi:hypothetical protein
VILHMIGSLLKNAKFIHNQQKIIVVVILLYFFADLDI